MDKEEIEKYLEKFNEAFPIIWGENIVRAIKQLVDIVEFKKNKEMENLIDRVQELGKELSTSKSFSTPPEYQLKDWSIEGDYIPKKAIRDKILKLEGCKEDFHFYINDEDLGKTIAMHLKELLGEFYE